MKTLSFSTSIAINVFLSILVIGGSAYAYNHFQQKETKPRKGMRRAPVRLVETTTASVSTTQPIISANGIVKAKSQISIRSEIKGTIAHIPEKFDVGGQVKKGEEIVFIENEVYKLSLEDAYAQLDKLQARHQIELGKQKVAEMEYKISGANLDSASLPLLMREPYVKQAEAEIRQAKTDIEKVKINLNKTTIEAPFDAAIIKRSVDVGSVVKDNTSIMDLIATDSFWIEVPVPTRDLRWINIPNKMIVDGKCTGSQAKVMTTHGVPRNACVVSLKPVLDNKIKTATVLLEINDPLSLKPENKSVPPILVNDFVSVKIQGVETKSVKLDRNYVHGGEYVWIMNNENLLERRNVKVSYKERNDVLIESGLFGGERVITTPLVGAVEGIALKDRSKKSKKVVRNKSGESHAS